MASDALLDALKQAIERDPDNGALWSHYAGMLLAASRTKDAIDAFRSMANRNIASLDDVCTLVRLLRESGETAEALIRAEKSLESAEHAGLRAELDRVLAVRGTADDVLPSNETAPVDTEGAADESDDGFELEDKREKASVQPDDLDAESLLADIDAEPIVTFRDVVGLDAVKKQIYLRIIAPFKKQEIYKAFSRKGGGGILLYGPPGCGKTFLARATAGECNAHFVPVMIHDLIDCHWGESEKIVRRMFDEARRRAPTVLFFDEFDALGASRGRSESQFWRTLVNQILQEMDGIGGSNSDVLVFAATNMPWNVDPAFRRPGRFDRLMFIPPPDEVARTEMLRRFIGALPGGEVLKVESIAKKTPLLTGADLRNLCDRASESALARSIETDQVHPVSLVDFEEQIPQMHSSAVEWLTSARNYGRYSNEAGQYDDLVAYLKSIKMY